MQARWLVVESICNKTHLLNKLLHGHHNVFVQFEAFHRRLCDLVHALLRHGRFRLVERRELRVSIVVSIACSELTCSLNSRTCSIIAGSSSRSTVHPNANIGDVAQANSSLTSPVSLRQNTRTFSSCPTRSCAVVAYKMCGVILRARRKQLFTLTWNGILFFVDRLIARRRKDCQANKDTCVLL